jgi:hypothetical protein
MPARPRRCYLILPVQSATRPDLYWCDTCAREVVEVKTAKRGVWWRHVKVVPRRILTDRDVAEVRASEQWWPVRGGDE